MKKIKLILPLSLGLISLPLFACNSTTTPNTPEDPGTNDNGQTEPKIDDTINWDEEKLGDPKVDPTNDNNRVFYEIFPISFSDSNGDGKGDINGIINRLDYLNDGNMNSGKSLGVQGLWLTPIHPSPSYHKYDVKNYYEIDSTLGTMADYEDLLYLCHKRNVKVIMDLVLNHTSDQHEWFSKFKTAHVNGDTTNKYYNWYTWYPEKKIEGGVEVSGIPSNISTQKISGTDHYFECNFSSSMPELNYDNEEVYNEIVNVAKFWIDKGVDGFRFDAAKYIYYDDDNSSINFWKKYVTEIKQYAKTQYTKDLYTVGEVWSSDGATIPYSESGLNVFNFGSSGAEGSIASCAKGITSVSAYNTYTLNYINSIKNLNEDANYSPFISNHDMDRSAGFWQNINQAKVAANLYILGPGSPFIYYGEEIGIKGARGGDQTDANRRLKMRWGNYGDLEDKVSNPTGSTYAESKQTNGTVETQINSKSSLLTHYRHLIQLRLKYPMIASGTYETAIIGGKAGVKITKDDKTIFIVHNNTTSETTIDLKNTEFSELLDYIGVNKATVDGTKITIGAQTSIIIG